jgi:hypothetical protein
MNRETRMHSFETPAPTRLRVEIPKGRIKVVAEETGVTRVELTAIDGDAVALNWIADAEVTQNGDEILVRVHRAGLVLFGIGGAIEALVHAPLGSAAVLSTGSGRIETTAAPPAAPASSAWTTMTKPAPAPARAISPSLLPPARSTPRPAAGGSPSARSGPMRGSSPARATPGWPRPPATPN